MKNLNSAKSSNAKSLSGGGDSDFVKELKSMVNTDDSDVQIVEFTNSTSQTASDNETDDEEMNSPFISELRSGVNSLAENLGEKENHIPNKIYGENNMNIYFSEKNEMEIDLDDGLEL